jgi:hypothetical protein
MKLKSLGVKKMNVADLKIPNRAEINQEYVDEFENALRKDGTFNLSKVSLKALFADFTYLRDDERLANYFRARARAEGAVAIIEKHEVYGLVWHSLFTPNESLSKSIQSEFLTEYKSKSITEAEVEERVASLLESEGEKVRRQVRCNTGTADIVTENKIIEVKRTLTISSVKQAIGQLLMYSMAINPGAELVVAGITTAESERAKKYLSALRMKVIELKREDFA